MEFMNHKRPNLQGHYWILYIPFQKPDDFPQMFIWKNIKFVHKSIFSYKKVSFCIGRTLKTKKQTNKKVTAQNYLQKIHRFFEVHKKFPDYCRFTSEAMFRKSSYVISGSQTRQKIYHNMATEGKKSINFVHNMATLHWPTKWKLK